MPGELGTAFVRIRPNLSTFRAETEAGVGGAVAGAAKLAAGVFAGIKVGQVFLAGVRGAIDFEEAMRNVNSIAHLSEKQFSDLGNRVRELSGPTGQGPKTLAEGLYSIVSSGFDANDAITILRNSAKAASAGMTDTATATRGVVAVLNAYHLTADKARAVSDTLFQEVNLGVNTFEELSNSIGDTAPAASALGIPFEEVSALLATITRHGTSMAEASTQASRVLTAMVKPTDALREELAQMGFASGQAAVETLGFTGVMQRLSKDADGNQEKIAAWLGDIRGIRGVVNATGKNLEEFNKLVRQMGDAQEGVGATQKAFAEQTKSLAFQWRDAKATLQAAAIPILSILLPALKLGAQGVKEFAEVLPRIGAFVREHRDVFAAIGGSIGGLVTGLVAYKTAMLGIAAAQAIMAATSPFTAIFAIVGALAALVASNEGLRDKVIGAWTAIRDTLAPVATVVQGALSAIRDAFAGLIDKLGGSRTVIEAVGAGLLTFAGLAAVIATFSALQTAVVGLRTAFIALDIAVAANPLIAIAAAVAALVTGLVILYQHSARFREIVGGAFEAVQAQVQAFQTFLQGIDWGSVFARIGAAVTAVADVLRAPFEAFRAYIERWFDLVGDLIHGRWDEILGDIGGILAGAVRLWLTAFTTFATRIAPAILDGLAALGPVLVDAAGRALDALKEAFAGLPSVIREPLNVMIAVVRSTIETIGAVFSGVVRVLRDVVELVSDIIHGRWREVIGDLGTIAVDVLKGLGTVLLTVLRGAFNVLTAVALGLGRIGLDLATALMNAIAAGLSKLGSLIVQPFIAIWEKVKAAFSTAALELERTALLIVRKIVEPFTHIPGAAFQWARDLKDRINADLIKIDVTQIHTRLVTQFRQAGVDSSAALRLATLAGVRDASPVLTRAAEILGTAIANSAGKGAGLTRQQVNTALIETIVALKAKGDEAAKTIAEHFAKGATGANRELNKITADPTVTRIERQMQGLVPAMEAPARAAATAWGATFLKTMTPYLTALTGVSTTPAGIAAGLTPAGSVPTLPGGGFANPLGARGTIIGSPGSGTHSFSAGPNNWESDNAIDIAVKVGTPVVAVEDGHIGNQIGPLGSGDPRMAGMRVHLLGLSGNEYYYAHLVSLNVRAGQPVKKGDIIGYSGSANGTAHLHFASKGGTPVAFGNIPIPRTISQAGAAGAGGSAVGAGAGMANIRAQAIAAAKQAGIDPRVFLSLIQQESSFRQLDPRTGRVLTSSAGAQGLTQLMPDTARSLGVDPLNIKENLRGGAMYLAQQLKTFGGDYVKALEAYNAGPAGVLAKSAGYAAAILKAAGVSARSLSVAGSGGAPPPPPVRIPPAAAQKPLYTGQPALEYALSRKQLTDRISDDIRVLHDMQEAVRRELQRPGLTLEQKTALNRELKSLNDQVESAGKHARDRVAALRKEFERQQHAPGPGREALARAAQLPGRASELGAVDVQASRKLIDQRVKEDAAAFKAAHDRELAEEKTRWARLQEEGAKGVKAYYDKIRAIAQAAQEREAKEILLVRETRQALRESAMAAAETLVPTTVTPADVDTAVATTRALFKRLADAHGMDDADRNAIARRLEAAKKTIADGLGTMRQAVDDARERFRGAWDTFKNLVLQAFAGVVTAKFQLNIDFGEATLSIEKAKIELQQGQQEFAAAISGGDTAAQALAGAFQQTIAAQNAYYAALASNDRTRIKEAATQYAVAQETLAKARITANDSTTQEVVKAITTSGDQILGAQDTLGQKQVDAAKKKWEDLASGEQIEISNYIDTVYKQIVGGQVTFGVGMEKIKQFLLARGLDLSQVGGIMGQAFQTQLNAALVELPKSFNGLQEAINTLSTALVAVVNLLPGGAELIKKLGLENMIAGEHVKKHTDAQKDLNVELVKDTVRPATERAYEHGRGHAYAASKAGDHAFSERDVTKALNDSKVPYDDVINRVFHLGGAYDELTRKALEAANAAPAVPDAIMRAAQSQGLIPTPEVPTPEVPTPTTPGVPPPPVNVAPPPDMNAFATAVQGYFLEHPLVLTFAPPTDPVAFQPIQDFLDANPFRVSLTLGDEGGPGLNGGPGRSGINPSDAFRGGEAGPAAVPGQELVTGLQTLLAELTKARQTAIAQDKIDDELFRASLLDGLRRTLRQMLVLLRAQLVLQRDAWTNMTEDVLKTLGNKEQAFTRTGARLGNAFAAGLDSQVEAVKKAATNLATAASKILEGKSPTEEGPLSTLDHWWDNFADTLVSPLRPGSISDALVAALTPTGGGGYSLPAPADAGALGANGGLGAGVLAELQTQTALLQGAQARGSRALEELQRRGSGSYQVPKPAPVDLHVVITGVSPNDVAAQASR